MTKIVNKKTKLHFVILNILMKQSIKLFFKLPIIEDKTVEDKNAQKIVRLYSQGEYAGLSAKIRFWDAPLQEFEKIIPKKGKILDLGCGEGILTNYLALSSPQRKLIGIEFNKARVKAADHGVKNAKFIYGDVLKKPIQPADVIVMSHMLHHLPSRQDQLTLIRNCYKSLHKDGQLIIEEVDRNISFKYLLGWVTDVFIVPLLFEKQIYDTHIFHRSREEWKKVFKDEGFKNIQIQSIKGGPFPDIFIKAFKK